MSNVLSMPFCGKRKKSKPSKPCKASSLNSVQLVEMYLSDEQRDLIDRVVCETGVLYASGGDIHEIYELFEYLHEVIHHGDFNHAS